MSSDDPREPRLAPIGSLQDLSPDLHRPLSKARRRNQELANLPEPYAAAVTLLGCIELTDIARCLYVIADPPEASRRARGLALERTLVRIGEAAFEMSPSAGIASYWLDHGLSEYSCEDWAKLTDILMACVESQLAGWVPCAAFAAPFLASLYLPPE